jgi:hypothetical protein
MQQAADGRTDALGAAGDQYDFLLGVRIHLFSGSRFECGLLQL